MVKKLQELIYAKTNVGGWFFDAFIHTDHISTMTITSHPVQSGAAITDHAYMNPEELTMRIKMTDVAESIVFGQFSEGPTRSIAAYKVLMELQKQRIPIQVVTKLKVYKSMLIVSISVSDDYSTLYGLDVTIQLKEILVATVKTIKISSRPYITNETNKGNPEPVKPNQSILKQWGSLFGLEG